MAMPDFVRTQNGRELGKVLVFNGCPVFFYRDDESLKYFHSIADDEVLVLENADLKNKTRYVTRREIRAGVEVYVKDVNR